MNVGSVAPNKKKVTTITIETILHPGQPRERKRGGVGGGAGGGPHASRGGDRAVPPGVRELRQGWCAAPLHPPRRTLPPPSPPAPTARPRVRRRRAAAAPHPRGRAPRMVSRDARCPSCFWKGMPQRRGPGGDARARAGGGGGIGREWARAREWMRGFSCPGEYMPCPPPFPALRAGSNSSNARPPHPLPGLPVGPTSCSRMWYCSPGSVSTSGARAAPSGRMTDVRVEYCRERHNRCHGVEAGHG